jgi:class 3 adenylate cyclase
MNIAARIRDRAEPGEVWVSDTVRQLLIGSDVDFSSRGCHELKGIPGPWPLFAAG